MYKSIAPTLFLGKNIVYLPMCQSTNDIASGIAQNTAPMEGTIVITDEQTQGKGQRGNSWDAEKGMNLTFSVVFLPTWLSPSSQFGLSMAAALAVRETAQVFVQKPVSVKWPNDIFIDGKKLSGILIENTVRGTVLASSIVGIGINVNQKHFKIDTATSLSCENGENLTLQHVLDVLLINLEKYYFMLKSRPNEVKEKYISHMLGLNHWRSYKNLSSHPLPDVFEASIVDVADNGMLKAQTQQGCFDFGFKEIGWIW